MAGIVKFNVLYRFTCVKLMHTMRLSYARIQVIQFVRNRHISKFQFLCVCECVCVCVCVCPCSLQDFAIGGYILECTEYLRHNLICFVIQVIILVLLVVYNR